ncbi:DUF2283 domain-containing protein [Herbiconiux sp. SYSU D00978]|uniref:DUF2283 domain-containing protein n=1 Tax=Herbiconiux sp. SYSU D00978 TaxID=2812562 RepID=UPI001A978AD5|nr:DUF2283 domain-containing protein [Herbiconiux sp. SYSU D00978]
MSVPHVAIDTEADAAYVYLVPEIEDDEAAQSLVVEVPGGEITIDLDEEGRVLGFEIVGAAALLRPETLEDAEDVTD